MQVTLKKFYGNLGQKRKGVRLMAVNQTPFLLAVVVGFDGTFRGHTRKPQPSLTPGMPASYDVCCRRSHRLRYKQLVNPSNVLFIAKARIDKFFIKQKCMEPVFTAQSLSAVYLVLFAKLFVTI